MYMWRFVIGVETLTPQLQRKTSSGDSVDVLCRTIVYFSFVKNSVPSAQRRYHEDDESLRDMSCLWFNFFFLCMLHNFLCIILLFLYSFAAYFYFNIGVAVVQCDK